MEVSGLIKYFFNPHFKATGNHEENICIEIRQENSFT